MAAPGDADNDGIPDAAETGTGIYISASDTGTDPGNADTDGDSLPDGLEIDLGTDPNSAASKIRRPNIIYILADDLGYGDVGCFWQNKRTGTWKFSTPGIDRMAAEGAKMTHTYVGAPICASSRCSFLQGQTQGHATIRNSQFDFPLPNNHSVSSLLQDAGYYTVHIGKAGLAGTIDTGAADYRNLPAHPMKRGFDRFFGYLSHYDGHEHYPQNGNTSSRARIINDYVPVTDAYPDLYTSDAFTGYAKKIIIEETQQRPDRPFFIYLSYDTPHFYGAYSPAATYPSGRGLTGGIQWTGAPAYVNTATNNPANINNYANRDPQVSPAFYPAAAQHVSMIRRMDDSITDLLQTLRDLGIAENTLVVFTSDNGPADTAVDPRSFQSYASLEGIKGDIWEGGIRVPTVVWWPGNIRGTGELANIREITKPTGNWDWMATFADLAKVPAPSFTDGVSLVPTLTGQGTQADRGFLYFEFFRGGNTPTYSDFRFHSNETKNEMQAIRVGNFMGVRTNIAGATDPFRIYDVTVDPGQTLDLASGRQDLQQRMQYLGVAAHLNVQYTTRPNYDTALIPASSPGLVLPGLRCDSFQGHWRWLPEFREMTPIVSQPSDTISASQLSRQSAAGLAFSGYIDIKTAGPYRFSTTSDGATCLWIDETRVVENDRNYVTTTPLSRNVYLDAGLHPIRLHYRHTTGDAKLSLTYSGPGITPREVPAAAYFRQQTGSAGNSTLPGTDPDSDIDGDGATHAAELIAGTDPADPASVLKFTEMSLSNGSIHFKWQGVAGRTYRIQQSADLVIWTDVPEMQAAMVPADSPPVPRRWNNPFPRPRCHDSIDSALPADIPRPALIHTPASLPGGGRSRLITS